MRPWASSSFTCLLLLFTAILTLVNSQGRQFQYKYSFKPPYLTKSDGTIPFWSFGGHAIPSEDSIRITPSLKNKRGWVWTASPTNFGSWEFEVAFRVTGRGRIGADGIAIWFTAQPGFDGPVYGVSDKWNGLGIFLDTYDNDQRGNNPTVLAVLNDGNKVYNHDEDGSDQLTGLCMRDFRNKPNAVRLRVRLYQKRLTVSITNGVSDADEFEPCFDAEIGNITLPTSGYFGVSAATGALADDHDVQYFLTHSLSDPTANVQAEAKNVADSKGQDAFISEDDRKKFESEFKGFLSKLELAKVNFEKEFGTTTKSPTAEDVFELESDRNVRQIMMMQSDTLAAIRQVQNAVQTLATEKTHSIGGASIGQRIEPGSVLHATLPELARKSDLQSIQSTLGVSLNVLQRTVEELQRKIDTFPAASGGNAQNPNAVLQRVDDVSRDLSGAMRSLKDEVQKLQNGLNNQQNTQPACSCVSTTTLVLLLGLQVVIVISFQLYQKNSETKAKKFY